MIQADLHVHSCQSHDGRSTIPELIAAAKLRGLDALAVCDHDLCAELPRDADILLIPSVELTTTAGHILGLFLERPVDVASLNAGGCPTVKAAVNAIHACGGLAVLAHPFAPQKMPADQLSRFPVDAIEAQNARAALKRTPANRQALELAQAMQLPATGGSDAHCADEIGGCFTRFACEEKTLAALKKALRQDQCEAVFHHPCRWKYKGQSRLERDRRQKQVSVKTYLYLAYTRVRDLLQPRQK